MLAMIQRWFLCAIMLALCALPAAAHDIARSESALEVKGPVVSGFHILDASAFPAYDINGNGSLSYEELDAAMPQLAAFLKANLRLLAPNPPIKTEISSYNISTDNVASEVIRLDMTYTFDRDVSSLKIVSTLPAAIRPDHVTLLSVKMGGAVQNAALGQTGPSEHVFAGPGQPHVWETVSQFVRLGITHILTGYDHLSFLLLLIIATANIRSIVLIATSFTVAHSITLALAAFQIIVIPGRITESAIAASIVYVALENILQIRAMKRYLITFLFGLIHGFGFSSVLQEMLLPRQNLALSLVSFNGGVEVGQLAFIAVTYPLLNLVLLRKWPQGRLVLSGLIMVAGAFWFIQRAFAL